MQSLVGKWTAKRPAHSLAARLGWGGFASYHTYLLSIFILSQHQGHRGRKSRRCKFAVRREASTASAPSPCLLRQEVGPGRLAAPVRYSPRPRKSPEWCCNESCEAAEKLFGRAQVLRSESFFEFDQEAARVAHAPRLCGPAPPTGGKGSKKWCAVPKIASSAVEPIERSPQPLLRFARRSAAFPLAAPDRPSIRRSSGSTIAPRCVRRAPALRQSPPAPPRHPRRGWPEASANSPRNTT